MLWDGYAGILEGAWCTSSNMAPDLGRFAARRKEGCGQGWMKRSEGRRVSSIVDEGRRRPRREQGWIAAIVVKGN